MQKRTCSGFSHRRLPRREIETLASHLTVGETYFFREKKSFDHPRRAGVPGVDQASQRQRQEAAHLERRMLHRGRAIFRCNVADRMIPDLADWNITILATDINPTVPRNCLCWRLWGVVISRHPSGDQGALFSPIARRRECRSRSVFANGDFFLPQPR